MILGLAVVAVIAALAVYLILPIVFPPSSVALPFHEGLDASYAYGSCTYAQFSLSRPAMLTGSFVTSASATFYVFQGTESFQGAGGCLGSPTYAYSSGPVRHGNVNVTLDAGTFTVAFVFDNKTNTQTWLNITQSFVAQYNPVNGSPGELCASLACHQHNFGPQGPGGTN